MTTTEQNSHEVRRLRSGVFWYKTPQVLVVSGTAVLGECADITTLSARSLGLHGLLSWIATYHPEINPLLIEWHTGMEVTPA